MKIILGTLLILLASAQVIRNAPFAAPVRAAPVATAPIRTAPVAAPISTVSPTGVWPSPAPFWGGNPWEYQMWVATQQAEAEKEAAKKKEAEEKAALDKANAEKARAAALAARLAEENKKKDEAAAKAKAVNLRDEGKSFVPVTGGK